MRSISVHVEVDSSGLGINFVYVDINSSSLEPGFIYVKIHLSCAQADDLEVNVGVWRGESSSKDGATYPNGWGVLTYKLNDTLNRDKYKGD